MWIKCQTVKIQSPCTSPTCWPRSCFRRGCILHIARCFFISLAGWRIKLLLSFDAYFCFVTNSLRKKKQTNNTTQKDFVSLLPCIMASRHINLSAVRTETLQCNTYKWSILLNCFFAKLSIPLHLPLHTRKTKKSSNFSKHYLLYNA